MNIVKRNRLLSIASISFLLMLVLFAVHGFAQVTNAAGTNAPSGPSPVVSIQSPGVTMLIGIIPLLVPILVALAKMGIPKLPSWTLPIIATCLGALINYIASLMGASVGPIMGALLGAAGVGVREIYDQVKTSVTTTGAAALLVFGLLIAPVVSGCQGSLQPGGAYAPGTTSVTVTASGASVTNFVATAAPDYPFFEVDASFDFAYSAVNAIFDFERDNRAMLYGISPTIKHTLDGFRPQAVSIRNDYIKARIAYMANPLPPNMSALQDALSRIKALATAAQAAIPSTIKIQ